MKRIRIDELNGKTRFFGVRCTIEGVIGSGVIDK